MVVVMYELNTGRIRATIEGASEYPGTPPAGMGTLTVGGIPNGLTASDLVVDVATGKLREKTLEEKAADIAARAAAVARFEQEHPALCRTLKAGGVLP